MTTQRTPQQRETIRGLIAVPKDAPAASDQELDQFLAQADAAGLEPLKRHIYGQIRQTRSGRVLAVLASIDGLRAVAERSGVYQGQEGPFWLTKDGQWVDVWVDPGYPVAAKVGVWREGFRSPCWAVARWEAYAQTKWQSTQPTEMWEKFHDLMLAKVAEALALRKAFPNQFGGIYTKEEMDQAERHEAKATSHQQAEQASHEAQEGLAELGLDTKADAPTPEAFIAFVTGAGPGAESMAKAIVAEIAGAGKTYRTATGHDRSRIWAEFTAWQAQGAPAPVSP